MSAATQRRAGARVPLTAPAVPERKPGRPCVPASVRLMRAGCAVLLVLYAVQLVAHPLPGAFGESLEKVATNVVFIGAAVMCALRGALRPGERLAWSCFAAGLGAWGLGNLYFTFAIWGQAEIPIPSPADVGYLAMYPFVYVGLILLVRRRVAGSNPRLWLDGAITALATGALGATVAFDAVLAVTHGPALELAVGVAYPLADLLLCGLVVVVIGMNARDLAGAWAWIACALLIFAATDTAYLYGNAVGSYATGALIDIGWPLAAWMLATAAWRPARVVQVRSARGWPAYTGPVVCGAIALGILVVDHIERVNLVTLLLSAASLLSVLARLVLALSDNGRLLRESRAEASTDGLTRLGNRRALLRDLGDPGISVLALYDLNGFKVYNDSFGHLAGDALLARLGAKLACRVGSHGRAYRLGGDEFCVVWSGSPPPSVIAQAAEALTEAGEGFFVDCSYGAVRIPDEAESAEAALRLADQRMYGHKRSGRRSAARQATDALLQALVERRPDFGGRLTGVADLAEAIGRTLGVHGAEAEHLRLAAELHDIGKVAIPDAILDKAGPLDDAELTFVLRHPTIGERIIAAAPELVPVANLVRSTHERVDGRGYPDGLRGDEIPLGARVIAVADAYEAMTNPRHPRAPLDPEETLAEIEAGAGTQFDPVVVRALVDAGDVGRPAVPLGGVIPGA